MSEKETWVMPEWMEKYRPHFTNTGGNSVEELMNTRNVNVFTNAPLTLIVTAVESQVGFLRELKKAGLIE